MLNIYLVEATHPLYHLNNDMPSVFVVLAKTSTGAHDLVEDMIGFTEGLKVTYLGLTDENLTDNTPRILHTSYRIESQDPDE